MGDFKFRARFGTNKNAVPSQKAFTKSANAQMQDIISQYADFLKHVERVTPQILKEALEPTFELSQIYVPKATGALAESGFLSIIGKDVVIGYGRGGKPAYAPFVHERMDHHHDAPTQAKFLERALDEDLDNVFSRVEELYGSII